MPRLITRSVDNEYPGHLETERHSSESVDVFYIPSKERIGKAGLPADDSIDYRIRLLNIDDRTQQLTIFPIKTTGRLEVFLKPKYPKIERITIADRKYVSFDFNENIPSTEHEVMELLEQLPSCFVKNYDHGLGLRDPYKPIVEAIESVSDCTEIVISDQAQTRADAHNKIFFISRRDFEDNRKSIDTAARNYKKAAIESSTKATRGFFAAKFGSFPASLQPENSFPSPTIVAQASMSNRPLSQEDQEALLDVLSDSAKSISETNPSKLATLQRNIEAVNLDRLISQYEQMFKSRVAEAEWQKFLNENHLVLSLAFGYPVIKVKDQASVGGHKISGSGDTIVDFLVKNSLTNNCAIVEIKNPKAKLLNDRPYRAGVYTPSGELVGAINQALDQKNTFERSFLSLKSESDLSDLVSNSVHCRLLIGTMPTTDQRKRSFELCRGNSKAVEIFTFDEILEKLKQVRDLLASPQAESGN